jgi:hypothetical protein
MTDTTYERVLNLCVVAVAASAVLMERFASLRWLAGGIGIGAGLIAVGVYLHNVWETTDQDGQRAQSSACMAEPLAEPGEIGGLWERGDDTRWTNAFRSPAPSPSAEQPVENPFGLEWLDEPTPALNRFTAKYLVLETPRGSFTDQIVEIVSKLATKQAGLELVIRRDGDFVIRLSRASTTPPGVDQPAPGEELTHPELVERPN